MSSLFDMKGRVNYAIQCIQRGSTDGRAFDACFEMFDGDEVVTAIIRRAEKNPRIMSALEHWSKPQIEEWKRTALRLRDLTDFQLQLESAARIAVYETEFKYYCVTDGYKTKPTRGWVVHSPFHYSAAEPCMDGCWHA
jgi:hypothetical protein